jgi:hypothetical protein
MTHENPQDEFETDGARSSKVDHTYKYHKKYFSTPKGKQARRSAERAYDKRDPERRRRQKREYMQRKRAKDPSVWRHQ